MANQEFLFFVLFFVAIAHLESVYSIDFELCEPGIITSKDGNIVFNSTEFKAEGKKSCRRVIYSSEGRVQMNINSTEAFYAGNLYNIEVLDGGFSGKKLDPLGVRKQKTYESTGNTMTIILKVENPSKASEVFSFRGRFLSVPLLTTCACTGIQNGVEQCRESFDVKKCEVSCTNGFEDLTGLTGNYSCNLLNGTWDQDFNSSDLGCQTAVSPSLVFQANLTLANSSLTCNESIKENISAIFKDYLKVNANISAKGQCFGNKEANCTIIDCVKNKFNNPSFVLLTIKDKAVTNPAVKEELSAFEDLFNAYKAMPLQEIKKQLFSFINSTVNGSTQLNNVVLDVTRQCPAGLFLLLNTTVGHPVCSRCLAGTFYSEYTCKKCPYGTSSPENSESCSPNKYNTAPLSNTCKIYCMPGKELNLKNGLCQWCPPNTYQNDSDVPNVNCTACPKGKRTLSPGATGVDQCYVPCKKGTFLSVTSQKCISCPLGTYQDNLDHLFTECKRCDYGKVTYKNGSSDLADCVPSCSKGHYLDSKTSLCLKCPIGSYQNNTNQLKCLSCPAGTSTLNNGSTNNTDCIETCQMGTYFDAQNNSCTECPIGTYMDQSEHLILSCLKCLENKTTFEKGTVNETQCLNACIIGEYFNVQNKSCRRCPLGSYMDESGRLMSSCKKCDGEKTTYKFGASDPKQCLDKCSVGEYFNSTISSCVKCPKGFYKDKSSQINCIPCPPGQTTEKGGETSDLACIKFMCGPGEYIDSDICKLCPNGTYQSAVNHTLSSCQQCPSKISSMKGAKSSDFCTKVCESFPCENGAECIETFDDFCKCPRGVAGKICEVIESKGDLQKVQLSVRFTSFNWSNEMVDENSYKYRSLKYLIENAVRKEFLADESFVGVQVTSLVKGSVIANFDLYTNDNASIVPAKTLQIAVKRGSVGGFPVDPNHLDIKQMTCDRALGMESGRIKDEQINASSQSKGFEASKGRLNRANGWRAKETTSSYFQINFHSNVNITAIATQGDAVSSYVTNYTLVYSKNDFDWMKYKDSSNNTLVKNFTGNNDTTSIVKNVLPQPITMVKYIRVIPVSWNNSIGMRIEVYGCVSDPVLSPDEIPTKPTVGEKTPDTTDPNVSAVEAEEDEYSWGKYLGITFGLLMVVGCLVAFFIWWRSSKTKQVREKAPLVMKSFNDGPYKKIGKNDELEYDDEHAV